MISWIQDFCYQIAFGGTRSFSQSEIALIRAVIECLPSSDAQILENQIRSIRLVQQPVRGRLSICFYPANRKIPELPYGGYEYCLAEVTLRDDNRKRRKKSRLMLHDGRLQSLEGFIPPKTEQQISSNQVLLHPKMKRPSTATALDRLEHGAHYDETKE
jgi:hypothetical protein